VTLFTAFPKNLTSALIKSRKIIIFKTPQLIQNRFLNISSKDPQHPLQVKNQSRFITPSGKGILYPKSPENATPHKKK